MVDQIVTRKGSNNASWDLRDMTVSHSHMREKIIICAPEGDATHPHHQPISFFMNKFTLKIEHMWQNSQVSRTQHHQTI